MNTSKINWHNTKKEETSTAARQYATYTQNRKLGNLGKFPFTSISDSSCNLDAKTTKN